ncbi:hypothetical protein PFICI_12013 [Pestalotiopsis fici W106-1]|uniref:Peptide N-acetyl-beta-D-glucosaminyl asparaginase amidase A N-terminal domain-containing protein n=1 Tax=Pestalotiopsis fici (strain W106-1 / CGMCC3.15140) TaxID=1229662 RepID=W3WUT9_PESFW|nr:uncharacterized protein PFICI_12013 [Pestalotiopsis fici W106-1]ETS76626.1 hypothetical protein PFICI_12013 [Pestalotiopsis fici W106-1]
MKVFIFLSLFVTWVQALATFGDSKNVARQESLSTSDQDATPAFLQVVQPYFPPRKSLDDPACRQTIVQHDFGNSYGSPYVGTYAPPADCDFTTTILNLTVTSQGRQYDRLALLYLGDTEIWRTSTAMPIQSGIQWTYQKDISVFHTLLTQDQKVFLSLDNILSGTLYTGTYEVTIEALYFNDVYTPSFAPADEIHPISKLASGQNTTSEFSLPGDSGSVNLTLARNIKQAVVSIIASGNSAEEFWFANVPSVYTNTFPGPLGELSGYSPFREVQLLIDGQLAGVEWPFPILFSGGVDPGAWRPIVGIDTYDLPTFEIDVTPWLSLLCDGEQHEFQLRVVGFDSTAEDKIGTIGSNWYVSGSLFVWLDESVNQTQAGEITASTGEPLFKYLPDLTQATSSNGTVTNTSLWFSLGVERTLSISSTIETADGNKTVSWNQHLSFNSIQKLTNAALNQSTSMVTQGTYSGSASAEVSTFQYPLNLYSSYDLADSNPVTSPGSVYCLVDRSLISDGVALLPLMSGMIAGPESLAVRQNVTSMYYWNNTIVEATGDNNTCSGASWLSFVGNSTSDNGVDAFGQQLQELDDAWVNQQQAWGTIPVPTTGPLPTPN